MMTIWNNICKELLEEKRKRVSEKEYQNKVFTHFFYLLNWYRAKVEQQYRQRVGSNVQYVEYDIVFFAGDEKLFVIEMKEPNHTQSKGDIEQLSSYMKLLPVQFGIYIGEHIELFYKPYNNDEPESVLKIEFIEGSNNGKTFVELFLQENFNTENLIKFCKVQIEKQEREKRVKEYINELTTEKGKQLIGELLAQKLCSEGYTAENIENIIQGIEISVYKKKQVSNTTKELEKAKTNIKTNLKEKGTYNLDHTHYKLNGKGYYGKGRLALAIVKQFVKENPHLSFYNIKSAVPLSIKTYSEIQNWKKTVNDIHKEKRWFEDQEELMTSSDGITFALTTQIGKGNIGRIIEFGEELGYEIEPIL